MTQTTLTPKDYKSDVKPTWCPGCGDFGVLNAIYNSMASLKLPLEQTVVVSGIGCSSRLPHFVETFGFHSLHGRALPVAQGMKMARPDLVIIAVGGDGDFFSIGAGHLIHAALRNIDITVVVMDNETYGLTKGQTSPTSPTGHTTKSTPYRSEEHTSELQSQSNLVCRLLLEKKQPHHVVAGVQAAPHRLVQHDQQAVPGHGSQPAIDILGSIEVHGEDRAPGTLTIRPCQRVR